MQDGHSSYDRYYECRECRKRITASSYRASCPSCGGTLRNLAVPRE